MIGKSLKVDKFMGGIILACGRSKFERYLNNSVYGHLC